jgi:GMP synthase-like glutamine amidotransferase
VRLHYIQHVYVENPGSILGWAMDCGHKVSHTLLYEEGFSFPDPGDFDWLIIMGGPMGANDEGEYPWIEGEKNLIRASAASGKIIVGFCLGAQLIASAMGGKVEANPAAEIGWHDIAFKREALNKPLSVFPDACKAFEWHNDTFSRLPEGATLFATGVGCRNQGFRIGDRIYAFQFHLESTREMLDFLVRAYADELAEGEFVQSASEILGGEAYVGGSESMMRSFLDCLAEGEMA